MQVPHFLSCLCSAGLAACMPDVCLLLFSFFWNHTTALVFVDCKICLGTLSVHIRYVLLTAYLYFCNLAILVLTKLLLKCLEYFYFLFCLIIFLSILIKGARRKKKKKNLAPRSSSNGVESSSLPSYTYKNMTLFLCFLGRLSTEKAPLAEAQVASHFQRGSETQSTTEGMASLVPKDSGEASAHPFQT